VHSETTGRTIHSIATVWFGAAILITARDAGWPVLLLWALGSWCGWKLLKVVPLFVLAAVLVPAGLVAQWQQVSEHTIPVHRVGVIAVGLVLTSLAYLMAPDNHAVDGSGRVLRWIGGITLIPAILRLGIASIEVAVDGLWFESLPIWLLMLGWATAVGFPMAVAAALRKRGAWLNAVAAGWAVMALQITSLNESIRLSSTLRVLPLILWCAIGGAALVASGVRESRAERINLGAVICAIAFIALTPFAWWLISWTALAVLGVCLWLLERTRRRFAAGARGTT
jgi:hypothetical protein